MSNTIETIILPTRHTKLRKNKIMPCFLEEELYMKARLPSVRIRFIFQVV
jgi:hypothetical protein